MAIKHLFSHLPSIGRTRALPTATASRLDTQKRAFEIRAGLTPGSTYESVLIDGREQGYVMSRSAHFTVWSEMADQIYVQGDELPSQCVARMWEGPRGAAVSEDEQWCVVVGLGLVAFRLRAETNVQSYGRRPFHERWQLHLPMKGDLADAVLFTSVRALGGHRFVVSTHWGMGNMWTTREWAYDADTNTLGEPRDIIDEKRMRAAIRPQRSTAYADEHQLAAALRLDGAESTTEAGITFEPNSSGGESVIAKGTPIGSVLKRSQRFVVWQELGSMACVEGEGLPWLLLDDMYGGAMAAAISPDEEWCIVVGCGIRVRRLRVAGEFRIHGADPSNILWLSQAEALDEHKFRLRSGAGPLAREYVYDADTDELRPSPAEPTIDVQ